MQCVTTTQKLPCVCCCLLLVVADVCAVPVKLHIFCTGPITPGLATFVLQAGGGSPGITMAGETINLPLRARRLLAVNKSGRLCWHQHSRSPNVICAQALLMGWLRDLGVRVGMTG